MINISARLLEIDINGMNKKSTRFGGMIIKSEINTISDISCIYSVFGFS